MRKKNRKITILCFIVFCTFIGCKQKIEKINDSEPKKELTISDSLKWSERMALSIMKRNSLLWQVDGIEQPLWDYKHGLLALSFEKLYEKTKDEKYYQYEKGFADVLIDSTGTINNYKMESYNIDLVNSGKILFNLYEKTKDEKYLTAIQTLRKQLDGHPRTNSGGFWHKKIYPYQMWLDGLYMGQPFYTRYTVEFEGGKNLDDIAKQFELLHTHTLDEKTGLLYHAWDESKQMGWADKETGKSPNFWSRAMGWYCMALVDVLDYFPADHPKQKQLILYLNEISTALIKFQDESGIWYQVTDMGGREGNYLEASGTAMFAYAFAKGADKGYLPANFKDVANKAFDGLIRALVKVDEDGEVHITQVCKGAGLGGNPYRDGSYEYYLSEDRRVDNLHGLGPFILAALALDR
ncbi:MAG: glycoside hydrolase family 88 protein [Chitinophagales bacterium]